MSARRAAYGSIAALKKIENRKIETASGTSDAVAAEATRKNSAESGMQTAMNGRRRPRRVQMRSDAAPTVGWITTPSMLRVLERRPVRRSGAPAAFSASGRRKLLNAKNAPAPIEPAEYKSIVRSPISMREPEPKRYYNWLQIAAPTIEQMFYRRPKTCDNRREEGRAWS